MPLDVIDCSFVLCQLLLLLSVVVAEVARVQNIVLQRVEVIGQRLNVMGTDEPIPIVFVRQGVLDVLQVVVRRQVELITGRDVIMNKLCTIFNHTEALIRVVLLARLDVDEVLLDVVLHSL